MLETYGQFILQTASRVLRRYVTRSDDAWSVALIAFWEATDSYQPDKGSFTAYAQLVIRRRLIDYQRREIRHAREISVEPSTFAGDGAQDASVRPIAQLQDPQYLEERLRDEIKEVSACLIAYGFTFDDLPDSSPKSYKTKNACAEVSDYLLGQPALIAQMRRCHRLPVQALAQGAHIPQKVIERHRNYIIAVAEILTGDYPQLSGYLATSRQRERK